MTGDLRGHNNPPEPSPFEAASASVDELLVEAKNWLDGSSVATQEEADAIGRITAMARAATKKLDTLRVEEKRPHDDAARAVQERFKPILARCDLIIDACKKSLTPFLAKLEAEKREAERIARAKADEARKAAEDAIRASQATDIEAREQAEAMLANAKRLEASATRAENDKAKASTGGRAMSLRTTYRAELTDDRLAARHYWSSRRDEFAELLAKFARDDVAAGAREIPGFVIHEEKVAV